MLCRCAYKVHGSSLEPTVEHHGVPVSGRPASSLSTDRLLLVWGWEGKSDQHSILLVHTLSFKYVPFYLPPACITLSVLQYVSPSSTSAYESVNVPCSKKVCDMTEQSAHLELALTKREKRLTPPLWQTYISCMGSVHNTSVQCRKGILNVPRSSYCLIMHCLSNRGQLLTFLISNEKQLNLRSDVNDIL